MIFVANKKCINIYEVFCYHFIIKYTALYLQKDDLEQVSIFLRNKLGFVVKESTQNSFEGSL